MCLGQKSGIEHAIHALRQRFLEDRTEGILLIDARNAFNSLNRDLALKNIRKLCPSIYTAIRNSYKTPSDLFIDKKVIKSQEGTTQGDPIAMAMYGVAILPLIDMLEDQNLTHKWYADDGNVAGSLETLRLVLDKLYEHGSAFGYNVIKCHLITKPEFVQKANKVFSGLDVDVIEGHRVLGSVIGSDESCNDFLKEKSVNYSNMLEKLAKHSKVSPQNVYKSFTNGLQHKLTFIARTTPNADSLLREAEKIIDKNLIPSMLNHPSYSDRYRKVFSLPLKEGGLNILLPEDRANEYERSIRVCEPLQNQNAIEAEFYQEKILQKIRKEKQEQAIAKKLAIKDLINDKEAYSLDLAMEKGASCWLNALPLKRYHFDLTKGEFRDGIALRYGWDPVKLPSRCACGENFNVAHALHCPKGGYTHIRHNDIRDSFANLLNEVCDDVEVEPCLQSLQGETFANRTTTIDDDARLDIKANGFFDSCFSRTFFDVKVFNPYAKSCPRSIPDSYKYHESIKKLKYEQRIIDVEKATFCPLIFSCTGGAGPSASKAIQRLASRISDKKEDSYSDVITYIRTKFRSFT